ncbi:MAG: hypothetical protein M1821_002848 [Bathelium mastoideum]|nr:MAG: hypothetical protein M1821_002848 [Bathelium mastoideum]KAI9694507.1 MAG: hypothetical protein M1822_000123 [Bathelium mastoideum]
MAARGGSRAFLYTGLAVAGGAGYYFYQAGGDPKVAQNKAEHDAARVSSAIKGDLPGKEKEVRTEGKVLGAEAQAKVDQTISSTKQELSKVDSKLDSYRKDAEKKIDQYSKDARESASSAVNAFDKTVEDKAAKAKSGLSGWFGGGSK